MQKITDNVYIETEFRGSNDGFVVTSEGVVMIDTPHMPADAVKWREEIGRYGDVRYLINTEPHGDHFTTNCFFGGVVVGHEGTREAVLTSTTERLIGMIRQISPESLPLMEGFYHRPPTVTFSQRLTLHVGDHTFRVIHLPGHTPFQVAVHVPEERVLFTSDNVFYRIPPFLHQAVPFEWLDSLKRMQEFDVDVLVPGHGDVCDPGYLTEMLDTIQAWIEAVSDAINRGLSLEEAQTQISFFDRFPSELKSDPMLQQAHGMNIARMYEVLGGKG